MISNFKNFGKVFIIAIILTISLTSQSQSNDSILAITATNSSGSIKLQLYKSKDIDLSAMGLPKGATISNYATGAEITSATFEQLNIGVQYDAPNNDKITKIILKKDDGQEIAPTIMSSSKLIILCIEKKYASSTLTLILVGKNGEYSPVKFNMANLTIK